MGYIPASAQLADQREQAQATGEQPQWAWRKFGVYDPLSHRRVRTVWAADAKHARSVAVAIDPALRRRRFVVSPLLEP